MRIKKRGFGLDGQGIGFRLYSYTMGTRVKRQVHEADHSLPSSAEVRSTWSYTSSTGHVIAQLVEALCYKPEGRGFESR
jgi:hypothetical protein